MLDVKNATLRATPRLVKGCLLAAAAAKDPLVADYTTSREHLLPVAGGRMVQYRNSNRLIKNPQWEA